MAIVGAETPIIYIYIYNIIYIYIWEEVKQLNGLIYIVSLPQEGIKVNQDLKTEICRESL